MEEGGTRAPRALFQATVPLAWHDEIEASMSTIEASFRTEQGRPKADCLRRDDYRCIVTGKVDWKSFAKLPSYTSLHVQSECAHILPFALGTFDEQSAVKVRVNKALGSVASHHILTEC